jgi:hypothetical protein
MSSEWMRVMLEEIARKKAEAEQARVEERQRAKDKWRGEEQRGEGQRGEERQSVDARQDAAELRR